MRASDQVINLDYFIKGGPIALAALAELAPPVVEVTMFPGQSFRFGGEPAADFLARLYRVADEGPYHAGSAGGGVQVAESRVFCAPEPEPDAITG